MDKHIDAYLRLRGEIDQQVEYLWDEHQNHMACRKGCDLCCLDFDVFPVELAAIQKQIKEEYPEVIRNHMNEGEKGRCAYLKNHACTIYNARPVICRTHGFPLLNMNASGDQWELSFCELNFTDVDDEYFEEDALFEQDTNNSKLYMLNKAYLAAHPELAYDEQELVPLKDILRSKE